jgi:DNA-binding GntR family transcriptional regulator
MAQPQEYLPEARAARRTLAEEAAAVLHELILSGEIRSGSPLRLLELSKRLDMSPMPIREGLRRLAALGLVELIPHRGAWVRELSADDMRDTYLTRLEVESLAVRAAAERFTDLDAQQAAAALAEQVRLSLAGELPAAREAHEDLHFTIYRACGSRWLPKAIEPLWQNSERYRFGSPLTENRIEQHRREHQAILDACVSHDSDAAERALRAHLENGMTRILATMTGR